MSGLFKNVERLPPLHLGLGLVPRSADQPHHKPNVSWATS